MNNKNIKNYETTKMKKVYSREEFISKYYNKHHYLFMVLEYVTYQNRAIILNILLKEILKEINIGHL